MTPASQDIYLKSVTPRPASHLSRQGAAPLEIPLAVVRRSRTDVAGWNSPGAERVWGEGARSRFSLVRFQRHKLWRPMHKRRSPGFAAQGRRASARRRPGYPLVGCTPAEPTSVSPGTTRRAQMSCEKREQNLSFEAITNPIAAEPHHKCRRFGADVSALFVTAKICARREDLRT